MTRAPSGDSVRAERVLAQLDRVEAELRRIGYWTDSPPDLRADYTAGTRESVLDAPTFELWLQAVFLHNAREAARTDTLPASSQVGLIALRQYNYHSYMPEAQALLGLLADFDALITGE